MLNTRIIQLSCLSCRMGTFGLIFEYGADKKVTQFSTLGASVVVGAPVGVTLKIR